MTSAESERLRKLAAEWRKLERMSELTGDHESGFVDGLMKAWRELEQTLDEMEAT